MSMTFVCFGIVKLECQMLNISGHFFSISYMPMHDLVKKKKYAKKNKSKKNKMLLNMIACVYFRRCGSYRMYLIGEIVRTYMIYLLGTYVTILYNLLIIWQNALYLYFGRSRMCLILQKTCYSSLVLKSWRLNGKTSEEKLFTKTGQIARHLRTDSSTATRQITIKVSIEI